MDSMLYMQGMSDNQKMLFMSEFNARRKDGTTGLILALLLGGIGAHRFYLGQVGLGVLYLVFCITFIPAIVGFFEAFAMSGRVDRYNDQVAMEVAAKIKMLGDSTAARA